jgi:hypothetical protein
MRQVSTDRHSSAGVDFMKGKKHTRGTVLE